MILSTVRFELVAATLEHVLAEIQDVNALADMLNVTVGSDWPPGEYDRDAQEFFRNRLQEGGPDDVGWYGWYVLLRPTRDRQVSVLVGAGGFTGPPDDNGEVEVGYSIVQAWEGHGIATELVKALVSYAFTDARVCRVIAHTSLQNLGSQKVLENTQFRCVGNGKEPGTLRYEIARTSL